MRGYRVVSDLFDGVPGAPVRGFVVWTPVLGGDRAADAEARAGEWSDPRAPQYWDARGEIAGVFTAPLGIRKPAIAWDVYLVYPPGVRWEGDAPPVPVHWEHQLEALTGAHQERLLEPDSLARGLAEVLGMPGVR